ncbi:hypothetical protein HanHA300_Chr03g0087731 [Helianthus annuus]|nr:hypothetical protein HanHA300_Chr03g0087731 [Helianthus annuus]KAJ0600283.1 hypothetical protein HanIR_Chr03g0114801 [Helianthus annuus]KAJ0607661.1 hypothetical protein HanHA89_Chr03g0099331 [Helianthus annuus]KAJ0767725.1 hypothetical protein HanLR1_Chr03g0092691 [Helianthus annuus]
MLCIVMSCQFLEDHVEERYCEIYKNVDCIKDTKLMCTKFHAFYSFKVVYYARIPITECDFAGYYRHLRLDGHTSGGDHGALIDQFNNPGSPFFIFLLRIST